MGAVMVKLPAGCAPGQKLTFTVPLSTVSRHVHSSGETGTQRYRMDRHLSEARNRHVFSLLPPPFSGHPAKRVCHVFSLLPPPFSGHPAKRVCLIASPSSFLSEASRPPVARGVVWNVCFFRHTCRVARARRGAQGGAITRRGTRLDVRVATPSPPCRPSHRRPEKERHLFLAGANETRHVSRILPPPFSGHPAKRMCCLISLLPPLPSLRLRGHSPRAGPQRGRDGAPVARRRARHRALLGVGE